MQGARLKHLTTKKSRLQAQLINLDEDLREQHEKRQQIIQQMIDIETEIKRIGKPEEPEISEHAILRYLERVKGFNIKELKQEMLSEKVRSHIQTLGSANIPLETGHKIVVRDNVVVTVK